MRYGRIIAAFGLYIGLVVAGCASPGDLGQWTGPVAPAKTSVQEWTFGEDKARVLKSAHYHVYTTIEDEEMLSKIYDQHKKVETPDGRIDAKLMADTIHDARQTQGVTKEIPISQVFDFSFLPPR